MKKLVLAIALLSLAGSRARASEVHLLGRQLRVSDPTGSPPGRRVTASGAGTLSAAIIQDPTATGATLTLIANGGTSTSQTFALDASGWSAHGAGYRYAGPTGADGDPVKRVLIKRTDQGIVRLRIVLDGGLGTQSLDIVPPDPGTDGGAILDIPGGDRYCIALGRAAGGTIRRDTARLWKIVRAVSAGCPVLATTTTTTTSTTSTTLGCLPDGVYYPVTYPVPAPCCSGGECSPVGPAACGCGPACDQTPYPTCGGNCYLSSPPMPTLGCVPIRVVMESGTTDQCGCPPVGECDPPCPCPSNEVCQFDFTTNTCGCVPL